MLLVLCFDPGLKSNMLFRDYSCSDNTSRVKRPIPWRVVTSIAIDRLLHTWPSVCGELLISERTVRVLRYTGHCQGFSPFEALWNHIGEPWSRFGACVRRLAGTARTSWYIWCSVTNSPSTLSAEARRFGQVLLYFTRHHSSSMKALALQSLTF